MAVSSPPAAPEPVTAAMLASCPVCRAINQAVWDFLCRYQFAVAEQPAEQRRFAARGGFCAFHTWQYADVASPRGIGTAYPALIERWMETLLDAPRTAGDDAAIASLPIDCELCAVQRDAEGAALAAAADDTTSSAGAALCLHHFIPLLHRIDDADRRRHLLRQHAAILERLIEDLRWYALKHDAVRRPLMSEEEATAAARALATVAGHRHVRFADDVNDR